MIRIPNPDSHSDVADWTELFVTVTGEFVSKAKLTHLLEQESGQEPQEVFVADVWRELGIRERLYEVPPFTVGRLTVDAAEGGSGRIAYVACLLMSLYGVADGSKGGAKLFERLSCLAAKAYLGGDAVVFGWPVESGENPSIRDRIIELASKLNERYVEAPVAKYKDRGVDGVAWKPFYERRPSQLAMLLQCAAGQDWRIKANGLPLRAWEQYIHWSNNPIMAFAVAGIIPDRDWHEVSKEGGVLFDRIRITNLTSELEKEDKALARDISRFIAGQLDEFT